MIGNGNMSDIGAGVYIIDPVYAGELVCTKSGKYRPRPTYVKFTNQVSIEEMRKGYPRYSADQRKRRTARP